ncbi:hypothetical protein OE766_29685 [Pararhizobium sp. YC-54]|uniref:hypothetical protein n=1 Tax=Pararhizobium sp. YC-54 TaxID=2986920 RepID=UPI0021F7C932|nr:hypothetical protein [Pararhizobium sp. YC-54]MCW0002353.1 hypothetical protein [Pararhizobium sp. YC-54]
MAKALRYLCTGTHKLNVTFGCGDGYFRWCLATFFAICMVALAVLGGRNNAFACRASRPKYLLILRTGLAGFPQLYLRDPDSNIVEINGAP